MTDKFYKYVTTKCKDGKYKIFKDKEFYGAYDNVRDALFDRDKFVSVEWDWDLFVEIPPTDTNPYELMELPPREKKEKYIYKRSSYQIYKTMDSRTYYFGSYNTFEEAVEKRDNLIMEGWIVPVGNEEDRYIYVEERKGKVKYCIRKMIDGKIKRFGKYNSVEEAREVRDRLIENNWDRKALRKWDI